MLTNGSYVQPLAFFQEGKVSLESAGSSVLTARRVGAVSAYQRAGADSEATLLRGDDNDHMHHRYHGSGDGNDHMHDQYYRSPGAVLAQDSLDPHG